MPSRASAARASSRIFPRRDERNHGPRRHVRHHDVFGDAQRRAERELLVDDDDAGRAADRAARRNASPCRQPGSRLRWAGGRRRGCSSASICRRRSRRPPHALLPRESRRGNAVKRENAGEPLGHPGNLDDVIVRLRASLDQRRRRPARSGEAAAARSTLTSWRLRRCCPWCRPSRRCRRCRSACPYRNLTRRSTASKPCCSGAWSMVAWMSPFWTSCTVWSRRSKPTTLTLSVALLRSTQVPAAGVEQHSSDSTPEMLGVGEHRILDRRIDFLRIGAGVERIDHLDAGRALESIARALLAVERPLRRRVDRGDHHLALAVEHLAHQFAGLAAGLHEVLAGESEPLAVRDCRC